jgi:hypothetical protein
MSIFTNPFFSVQGQIERLTNVAQTLNAAFNPYSKDTVHANVSNPTVKAVLEVAANHPYITAGLIAGGVTAGTGKLLSTGKELLNVGKSAGVSLAKAYPLVTAGAVISSPVSVPFVYQLAKSKKVQETLISLPSSAAQAGKDLSKLVDEPTLEKGIQYVKDHPALTAAVLTTIFLSLGYSSVMISQILATRGNTKAIEEASKGSDYTYNGQPVTKEEFDNQFKLFEAQAKQEQDMLKLQTEANLYAIQAQKQANLEIIKAQTPVIPPIAEVVAPQKVAPSAPPKNKKKAKKKTKKKAKKKTRRSKKKKKTIKRKRYK